MLTNDDINQLLEALDAWDREPTKNGIMSELVISMLTRGDPKAKEECAKNRLDEQVKERARKEATIKLRAKLIDMRPSLVQELRN